ncbi:MAG TPA: lipoprotein-releasing ABC transporter permease subunit [Leucothrix mucor]|nr:lipoprotein-releasing ABC transporter permease subunit [Leucothrix mucor]
MFRPVEMFIGLRYTKARRQSHFVSFISFSSMLGIALGVMVLIVVLSVMNGFESAMRDRILGMLSHVTVSETDAQIQNWQQRREQMLKREHVIAAAPFVERQVMLNASGKVQGTLLEGVLPEYEAAVSKVSNMMLKGSFSDLVLGQNNIILGVKLAESLKVEVGDSVIMLTPNANSLTSGELPMLREFNIVGMFRVDLQQYDKTTAYVHMQDAVDLFEMGDQVTGLRVQLDDLYKSVEVAEKIVETTQGDVWVSDWTKQNTTFFKAIQLQKTMMFFILGMIIAVAAFNLVSTLVMVVTDKESDIAIFRTLGLTPLSVMKVFMVQGTLIGFIGVILGVILGVLLAMNVGTVLPWIESLLDTRFISADVYGISEIESNVKWADVLIIAISALMLSMLATIYPAWKASKTHPAEALRYE